MAAISISLTAFTLAAAPLTITPGLDTALVLGTAVSAASPPAAVASLGIAVGCRIWATLVALGLTGAVFVAFGLALESRSR